jgi:DNA-binding GntR family transcriptional regulator
VAKVEYEDLNEKVYKALKEMILTGELPPGMKLRQENLSERLGVSRTPLLAAFSKLEKELLIELIPRRGAYVKKCTEQEMYDFADVRIRLEPLGARDAAIKATAQNTQRLKSLLKEYRKTVKQDDLHAIKLGDFHFHMEIMNLSGNTVLMQIISSFNIVIISNQRGLFKDPTLSCEEHAALVDAICRNQPDEAERLMAEHLAGLRTGIAALADKAVQP